MELGGSEIYQILRKRLFAKLPSDETIETVAQAYAQAIREAEKTKTIAKSAEQVVEEIRGSYPFHPSIKDIIALFRNNESYRQTRGLMQFVAPEPSPHSPTPLIDGGAGFVSGSQYGRRIVHQVA